MGKINEHIDERLRVSIGKQPVFFTAYYEKNEKKEHVGVGLDGLPGLPLPLPCHSD
ncbi:hypothetical protein [Streptomyces sp. HNM0575]|uniref:hypothetical protein n=1 Tax=Streptomyces sp. HNM0575 TaxID=2716338 RepID=UPI001F0DCFCB|nr:hypothetical protein [Streptomyces sp. HNM0575]